MAGIQWRCDVCHNVDAPVMAPPMAPLSETEGWYMTSCEACGVYKHHACGYDEATREYLHKKEILKQHGLPVQRIICKDCSFEWAYDPYNLKTADEVCAHKHNREVQKVGNHAVAVMSSKAGYANGGCLQVCWGGNAGALES